MSCATVFFVVCAVRSLLAASVLKPYCNLHADTRYGSPPPNHILPQKVNFGDDWLFVDENEVRLWYEKGKGECLAHLQSSHFKSGNDLADPNPRMETYPPDGQKKCRGTDALHQYSGVLLWPFGPISECPTYSKCWFGILSCGDPNMDSLRKFQADQIKTFLTTADPSSQLPEVGPWSIRAVNVHARVVGAEIVVPEQRYVTISDGQGNPVDVIVGQYVLTRLYDKQTKLELRQDEFYPSVLYKWSDEQREKLGVEVAGNVYLGSNEERCRPWTHCRLKNISPDCERQSFLRNTPVSVQVSDGKPICTEAVTAVALPLCPPLKSANPGRWIQSGKTHASSPFCEGDPSVQNPDVNKWFEASGDPCHCRNVDKEEEETGQWFYAPYHCRYHFYTKDSLGQCLSNHSITHIQFQGDSMSRDLYGQVSHYTGVDKTSPEELKRLTNVMQKSQLSTHSGSLLLTESYAWDWSLTAVSMAQEVPVPQVVITNYALAHRHSADYKLREAFQSTEYNYWATKHKVNVPQLRIYQTAKDVHGKKSFGLWSSENLRHNSAILQEYYQTLGFHILDEWLITAGRIDNYADRSDGWHFFGTMKQMEAVILFNMICNDWKR